MCVNLCLNVKRACEDKAHGNDINQNKVIIHELLIHINKRITF